MRVVHVVVNDYINDNRVRRAAECAANLFGSSCVWALGRSDGERIEELRGVRCVRIRLRSRALGKRKAIQFCKYAEFLVRTLWRAVSERPDVIHAHDFNGLIIAVLAKRLSGCYVIYDAHELWADRSHYRNFNLPVRPVLGFYKWCARQADTSITVSNSIARHMQASLDIPRPAVVRNVPEEWPRHSRKRLREELGISREIPLILYQGVIDGAGVDLVFAAFARLTSRAALVYMGNGTKVDTLRSRSAGYNVYFKDAVRADVMADYTGDADIGVHPMVGKSLNNIYALPNKVFEYIQGGLCVVCSNLPEMRRLVRDYDVGEVHPQGNVEAFASVLDRLLSNPNARNRYKANAASAADVLNWNTESHKLLGIYRRISVNCL